MHFARCAAPLLGLSALASPGLAQETHHITLPQPRIGDWFGMSVELDGGLGLVTRIDHHLRGAGYLVDLATGAIVRQYDPTSGDTSAGFGRRAALSGPHVVVSAPKESRTHAFGGAVHLYDRDTGSLRATFEGEKVWHWFGVSLDARDDRLLIGATADDDLGSIAGAVYVADLANLLLGPKLHASDGAADAVFGYDVALGADRAAIGAPGADGRGAVYVFDTLTWTELAKLSPLDLQPDDSFGASVAIEGDRLVAGATGADTQQGAVYVFELTTGALLRRIPSPSGQPGQFGHGLDLHGRRAIVSGGSGPWLVDIETGQVLRHLESCAGAVGTLPVAISAEGMLGGWFTEVLGTIDGAGGAYAWTDFAGVNLGANYCGPANANSTGQGAHLAARGCPQVDRTLFELHASQLPPLQPGYPLVSQDAGFVPFAGGGQGDLCLGGTIGRATALVQAADGAGEASFPVDLSALPQGQASVAAQPGETWRFQVWYRDANPQPTWNFTDGLAVTLE